MFYKVRQKQISVSIWFVPCGFKERARLRPHARAYTHISKVPKLYHFFFFFFLIQTKKQICKHKPPVIYGIGQITSLGDGQRGLGELQNRDNCLHAPGPTFLVSATPLDFLMSRFVNPPGRVNGGEGNLTAELSGGWGGGCRERRGSGQWEGRTRSRDITPPASGHRLHSVVECGRANGARAPRAAVNPVRARCGASPRR